MEALQNKPVKIIASWLGGSHMYKLNSPTSDEDIRGIFINTDASHILGLNRHDEERKQIMGGDDIVYKELSHYMRLLQQANTEALEALWCAEDSFKEIDKSFKILRVYRSDLIDSERFFKTLRGYAQGELRLAKGERTGVLGSKRREALEKYGYSPKNATNLLRLFYTGIFFYKEGHYVVDCNEFGKVVYNKLYRIKTQPETYTVEELDNDFLDLDKQLVEAFEKRLFTFKFNPIVANHVLLDVYYPYLKEQYELKS